MTTVIKIIVTGILSFLLFSCNSNFSFTNELNGNGNVNTKEHKLQNFNQISVSKGWEVELIRGKEPKMIVKANENLHQNLEFSVKNNVLDITAKRNIGHADAKIIKVYYVEDLLKIDAHSGAEITSVEIFKQNKIDITASSGAEVALMLETQITKAKASSGGSLELSGSTENFEVQASSGGEVEAEHLSTVSSKADASSGGEIELQVKNNITAEASSGGSIEYSGNPASKNIKNGVSGDIRKK